MFVEEQQKVDTKDLVPHFLEKESRDELQGQSTYQHESWEYVAHLCAAVYWTHETNWAQMNRTE